MIQKEHEGRETLSTLGDIGSYDIAPVLADAWSTIEVQDVLQNGQ